MMSLIRTWAPHFATEARTRGRVLHRDQRVTQVPAENGETVRAQVDDGDTYVVTLTGNGPSAEGRCTCEGSATGRYCEHLWATLLDIQQRGVKTEQPEGAEHRDHSAGQLAQAAPGPPKARKRSSEPRAPQRREPTWAARLAQVRPLGGDRAETPDPRSLLTERRQICYVVSSEMSTRHQGLVVEFRQRTPKRRGWGPMKRLSLSREAAARLEDAADRELCGLILGGAWVDEFGIGTRFGEGKAHDAHRLSQDVRRLVLRRLIESGRCYFDAAQGEEPTPLKWGGDEPWRLWLVGRQDDGDLEVTIELRRAEDRMIIAEPSVILGGREGLVIYDNRAAPFDDADAFGWTGLFRDEIRLHGDDEPIRVAADDIPSFLDRLYRLPQLPPLDLPTEVGRPQRMVEPRPHLALHSATAGTPNQSTLTGRVWFDYAGVEARPEVAGRYLVPTPPDEMESNESAATGDDSLILRDLDAEHRAIVQLADLGFRANPVESDDAVTLKSHLLPDAVGELASAGWIVTADQSALRTASAPQLSVRSGIDWFELHGDVRFETDAGEEVVPLPQILAAARQGKSMITLADGSHGMLPQEWLARHGLLTTVGELEEDHLRFKSAQAAMLDALLSQQDIVDVDERFSEVRQRLRGFDQVEPLEETQSFKGELRPYQRDGLGWLAFLRTFGFGGVLADDMGLGKTVQMLAMLVARYKDTSNGEDASKPHRPTLVVAPRSVVFNWLDEAARFAPDLRVADYSGTDRHALRDKLNEYHLVITSYGLMRRDAEHLVDQTFDYVVLDEAQAIKNPGSQAAKAARLLKCEHRIALTGTPVENHLGDLWSIFEFLNPGILGSATRFAKWVRGSQRKRRAATPKATAAAPPPSAVATENKTGTPALGKRSTATSVKVARQAGKALRPFILRRTKDQVLEELPDKTEQTIVCHMPTEQRKVYDGLLKHYRSLLLKKSAGGAGALQGEQTMLVIEALLRLRQAACHPALIDTQRKELPSAKLDALLEHLTELTEEGHKALVFSQFTSMLALVKPRLEAAGIKYEYLDGQTRDRKSKVERFQNDPDCPAFLISLKAGGLGLNLTAASYVFILDPWWNPAVEQQAIDRAHRIGQTRHVFAYRLICHDTVEQRIAELQQRKRDLADAIVGGQENVLRSLTREDLELLLK